MQKTKPAHGASAAFLLAQVGALAASRFAERLQPYGFGPQHAGILRLLSKEPGLSQQQLAKRLRMHASRLVGILDELQQRGVLERRPSSRDRRLYALHLTPEGDKKLAVIGQVAREHQDQLLAPLTEAERADLADMLARVAAQQGLSQGIHPGYASLPKTDARRKIRKRALYRLSSE